MSSTPHSSSTPITLCRYWVKPEKEAEFRKLLDKHWPLFSKLALVADKPAHVIFRGTDKTRGVFYVEIFPWKERRSRSSRSLPSRGRRGMGADGCVLHGDGIP
jgi:hypothetical protein